MAVAWIEYFDLPYVLIYVKGGIRVITCEWLLTKIVTTIYDEVKLFKVLWIVYIRVTHENTICL